MAGTPLIRWSHTRVEFREFRRVVYERCGLAVLSRTVSSGGTKGPYPEVRQWLEKALAPFPAMMHLVANNQVELNGDQASSRTYVINPMGFPNPEGGLHVFTVAAHYVDKLVRTPDGWRIAERIEETVLMDGSLPAALQIPQ